MIISTSSSNEINNMIPGGIQRNLFKINSQCCLPLLVLYFMSDSMVHLHSYPIIAHILNFPENSSTAKMRYQKSNEFNGLWYFFVLFLQFLKWFVFSKIMNWWYLVEMFSISSIYHSLRVFLDYECSLRNGC